MLASNNLGFDEEPNRLPEMLSNPYKIILMSDSPLILFETKNSPDMINRQRVSQIPE